MTSTSWTCSCLKAGAFYIMDRGYLDFARLTACIRPAASSSVAGHVQHPISSPLFPCRRPVGSGLICDQTIMRTGVHSATHYPEKLGALNTMMQIPAGQNPGFSRPTWESPFPHSPSPTVSEASRWQIELFFRWIKRTCASRPSTEPRRMPSNHRSGSPVSVYVLIGHHQKAPVPGGRTSTQFYRS